VRLECNADILVGESGVAPVGKPALRIADFPVGPVAGCNSPVRKPALRNADWLRGQTIVLIPFDRAEDFFGIRAICPAE